METKIDFLSLILVSLAAYAQVGSDARGASATLSMAGPAALHKGLGAWSHPIATTNPKAQKFFDQGLALLYGFNRYEALRSFRRVSELDPVSVMAYWGMAMAQGPYLNMDSDPTFNLGAACRAVASGKRLVRAPPREQAYLQAVATWCPRYRPELYTEAMRSLAAEYPDDLDAQTLYAESLLIPTRWHWYSRDGTLANGVAEAERVLEEVMRRWPDHPGANHYYIHALESSPNPERAIPSAQKLMGIVPAAGHLVHMPGHIWLVLGEWEAAAASNERAAEVDRQYFAANKITDGSYFSYYLHNLSFIVYARSMQGRKADALHAAEVLSKAAASEEHGMAEMGGAAPPGALFAYLRFGEWDRVLRLPQPTKEKKVGTVAWHYARTLSLLGIGDRVRALAEQRAFERARAAISPRSYMGQNKASDVLRIAAEILAARLPSTAQDSLIHWKQAALVQDGLSYSEPPDWYYPVRESWGAALLRAGRAADAEKVFREGARLLPRNGRMLFGLMQSLEVQGKAEEAKWVRREFEESWAKADVLLRLDDL